MRNEKERLRRIELSLTPEQIALLWIKNAVTANFELACAKSPFPREAIGNSVVRSVTKSLRGKPPILIQQAVEEARRQADRFYQIFVTVNLDVQEGFTSRCREAYFLYELIRHLLTGPIGLVNEERLRAQVLYFSKPIIVLGAALRQISAETFGGEELMCPDSASNLAKEMEVLNGALNQFNFFADELHFKRLSVEEILDSLRADIEDQVSEWLNIANGETLATFGQPKEFVNALRTLGPCQA